MQIGRVEGTTRVLGKSQGYIGLPVRDEVMFDRASGTNVDTMTTAWFPTPEELRRMNEGEAIHLRLFGASHPPVMLTVGGAEPHETTDPLRIAAAQLIELINNKATLQQLSEAIAALAGALNNG